MQASLPTIAYNIHQYPVKTRPQDMALSHRKRDAINYTIHPETVFPMIWVWSCFTHYIHQSLTFDESQQHVVVFFVNVSIWMFLSFSLMFYIFFADWSFGCPGISGSLGSLDVAWDGAGQDHADAEKHSCSAQLESKGTAVPWCSMFPLSHWVTRTDATMLLIDDRSNVTKDFWMTSKSAPLKASLPRFAAAVVPLSSGRTPCAKLCQPFP